MTACYQALVLKTLRGRSPFTRQAQFLCDITCRVIKEGGSERKKRRIDDSYAVVSAAVLYDFCLTAERLQARVQDQTLVGDQAMQHSMMGDLLREPTRRGTNELDRKPGRNGVRQPGTNHWVSTYLLPSGAMF